MKIERAPYQVSFSYARVAFLFIRDDLGCETIRTTVSSSISKSSMTDELSSFDDKDEVVSLITRQSIDTLSSSSNAWATRCADAI